MFTFTFSLSGRTSVTVLRQKVVLALLSGLSEKPPTTLHHPEVRRCSKSKPPIASGT